VTGRPLLVEAARLEVVLDGDVDHHGGPGPSHRARAREDQLRSAALNTAKCALMVKAGVAVKGLAEGELRLTIDAKG